MVQKVIWSPEALKSYLQILQYLQEIWTDTEVAHFVARVDDKLSVLQTNPLLGVVSEKQVNIHKTVLHKKVSLIYKFKPRKKELILLRFLNTQQDAGNQ